MTDTLSEPLPDNNAIAVSHPENVAPHSVEAEEAVLGSILLNPEALFEVAAFLQPTDFFIVRNKFVYEAILALHERGDGIDNLTVSHELRSQGQLDNIGGSAYLNTERPETPEQYESHCSRDGRTEHRPSRTAVKEQKPIHA